MGTDAYIYTERRGPDGEWEEVSGGQEYEDAKEAIEWRCYFVYALLAGIRNYYFLKENMIPKYEPVKRTPEVRERLREKLGLNEPRFSNSCEDDAMEVYAEFEISKETAREVDGYHYSFPWHVFNIDDLINFDYDQDIQFHIDESSIYYSNRREVDENHRRYSDNISDSFFEALKVMKNHGVERILFSFD